MPKVTQPIDCKTSMQTQASPTPELEGQSTTLCYLTGLQLPRPSQPHHPGIPDSPGPTGLLLSRLEPFDLLPLLPELMPEK